MEKLPGTEVAAEIAALKALVLSLAEIIACTQDQDTFKSRLLNQALTRLQRPSTWNAPKNPTEELKDRARSRCQQIVNEIG